MHCISKKSELDNCTPINAILMLIIVLYHSMIIFARGVLGGLTQELMKLL